MPAKRMRHTAHMWFLYTIAAVLCWAILNVIDSILVRHFESRPLVISWVQASMSVPMLMVIGLLTVPKTPWALPLLVVGVIGYCGDQMFWRLLSVTDASSSNFVGAFVAILMTLAGALLFQEAITITQGIGIVLVISGVGLLSFGGQKHVSTKALLLMGGIALANALFYIAQKWITGNGAEEFAALFWAMLGREITALTLSTLLPRSRRQILESVPSQPWSFFILNCTSISLFLAAMFFVTYAYHIGLSALVSTIGNIQPFIVIALAWLLARMVPRYAPRELLTQQSIRSKLVSFLIVFCGLSLLGGSML